MTAPLGQVLHSFFEDDLKAQKGLQPTSIRSYRDTLRLFLCFAAKDLRKRITQLAIEDLTFQRTQGFLAHLEADRHNHIRTRNQRLAALRTFFDYLARRIPEMIQTGQQVALIPVKRVAPAEMHFLERQELTALFHSLPSNARNALRDRTLLLFLYNTGARVQESRNFAVRTSIWMLRRACGFTARAINGGRALFGRKRLSSFGY